MFTLVYEVQVLFFWKVILKVILNVFRTVHPYNVKTMSMSMHQYA